MTFPSGRIWAALKAKGMLLEASTVLPGDAEPRTIDVRFWKPDRETGNGHVSREYEIEYQHCDAPWLAEGIDIIVDGTLYRVRTPPYINEEGGSSGYFRRALLTRLPTACSP